jgi:hypothetical protein
MLIIESIELPEPIRLAIDPVRITDENEAHIASCHMLGRCTEKARARFAAFRTENQKGPMPRKGQMVFVVSGPGRNLMGATAERHALDRVKPFDCGDRPEANAP